MLLSRYKNTTLPYRCLRQLKVNWNWKRNPAIHSIIFHFSSVTFCLLIFSPNYSPALALISALSFLYSENRKSIFSQYTYRHTATHVLLQIDNVNNKSMRDILYFIHISLSLSAKRFVFILYTPHALCVFIFGFYLLWCSHTIRAYAYAELWMILPLMI